MNSSPIPSERLKPCQKLGFSVADFGLNLYYTGLNLFLYYYYTDILEIRPGVAGLIFALPLIWDAVTDLLMGVFISRTKTRWGRYRPYILFGMVPLALSFVAMFAMPLLFPGAIVAVSAITHLVFRTCYTVVSIPYTALSANMTRDSKERADLAGLRMIFAPLGGLFTVAATFSLVTYLGGGDMKLGFFKVSILYGILATIILSITFASTRERLDNPESMVSGLSDTLRLIKLNQALWVLIGAILVGSIGSTVFGKALLYYVKYVLGLDVSITQALITLTIAVTLSVPFWTLISRKIAKRNIWMIGGTATLLAQGVLYLYPPTSAAGFIFLIFIMGCGSGSFVFSFWAMLPDTVEYGQWRAGIRDEGLAFGVNQLALKTATGIGIGLLGLLLELAGYIANQQQSPETLRNLQHISILVPMIFNICALILISRYPITSSLHQRLVRAISWRESRKE